MNNITIKDNEVKTLIYEIRGKQVMLDSDLARLYQCKNGTKVINQAVHRNFERFPEDFYFQLTREEYENLMLRIRTSNLKSQFVTSSLESGYGGVRKMPYVFTEQGVAMLSSVLRTSVASEVSIHIMRAFVAMRQYLSNNLIEQKYINNLVLEDHEDIKLLKQSFNEFSEKRKPHEIYFNGQIFDAYSKILEIFKETKEELTIIDSYVDKTTLDIIKNLENIKVTIITDKNNKYLTTQMLDKYNEQYDNLEVKYNNTFHDRYFILDNTTVYHCGASINRIGYKTFSITKIQDKDIIETLLAKI